MQPTVIQKSSADMTGAKAKSATTVCFDSLQGLVNHSKHDVPEPYSQANSFVLIFSFPSSISSCSIIPILAQAKLQYSVLTGSGLQIMFVTCGRPRSLLHDFVKAVNCSTNGNPRILLQLIICIHTKMEVAKEGSFQTHAVTYLIAGMIPLSRFHRSCWSPNGGSKVIASNMPNKCDTFQISEDTEPF